MGGDEAAGRQERLTELWQALGRTGRLTESTALLPECGVSYEVIRPDDVDQLLDLVTGDPEENLPYWAEIWPSGVALADAIECDPSVMRGQRVLELGCGLGITATAAIRAGALLTVTDYFADALTLCRYNVLANTGQEPETLQMNWRHPGDALLALAGDGFPIVLGADVLYEARDVEPLLALVERLVAPDGLFWLAEPARAASRSFVNLALDRGWQDATSVHTGPWPDPGDLGIVVSLHRLRRGPRAS